jgi:uncharacterized membrane protein
MAKKRGKVKSSKPKANSKKAKKAKAPKKSKPVKKAKAMRAEKTPETHPPLKSALRELEILAEEKKVEGKINGVEKKEAEIEKKEEEIEKGEMQIMKEEKKIEKEAEKVEKIERQIKKEVEEKPLTKFSMKDVNKGIIGAFVGVVAHFAFIYGRELAESISTARATVLLVASYFVIIILMYETGYRHIKEKRLLLILPRRATAIYLTSLVMIVVIFFLFNLIDLSKPLDLYKQIAVTSVLSSMGAGTADLIGRD